MRQVRKLWDKAHDLYAQARTCGDPLHQKRLLCNADDILKEADEIRRTYTVTKAEYPVDLSYPAVWGNEDRVSNPKRWRVTMRAQ